MLKDKVLIVCPTLDTIGNTKKRGERLRIIVLLRKIKPNGKTQEKKVEWGKHCKRKIYK